MNIDEAQEAIVADFSVFPDALSRYSYLIELSTTLGMMNEERKIDDRLVAGCQSRVWIDISGKDGLVYVEADSDTLIVSPMPSDNNVPIPAAALSLPSSPSPASVTPR